MGITLSLVKYVWLISADDYLRKPYVLERYVAVMELNPNVGYAFCPGYGVRDGVETRLLGRFSDTRDRDRIFPGHVLLNRLLQSNFVLTPSGMVRKECYEKVSLFDLNMPWCGDWYLWSLFAVYYDVAYFADPMLCYREHHDLSMTSQLTTDKLDACAAEEIAVPWLIRKRAQDAGHAKLSTQCLLGIARTYGRVMASDRYRHSSWFMNFARFEESLSAHAATESDREYLRARVFMSIANEYYWAGDYKLARQFYTAALGKDPSLMTVRIKRLLLSLGRPGRYVRKAIYSLRWAVLSKPGKRNNHVSAL
jgi:hypothetical protein